MKVCEILQSFEMFDSSIGQLRVFENEFLQVRHFFEIVHSSIGDYCVVDFERFEVGQPLEMLQTSAGDLRGEINYAREREVEADHSNTIKKRHALLYHLRNPIRARVIEKGIALIASNCFCNPLLPQICGIDADWNVHRHHERGSDHDLTEMPSQELPYDHRFSGTGHRVTCSRRRTGFDELITSPPSAATALLFREIRISSCLHFYQLRRCRGIVNLLV